MLRRSIASLLACPLIAVAFGCAPSSSDAPKALVSGDSTTTTLPTGLSITVPKDWKSQPASGMRQADWKIEKAEGDVDDAELVVYHFGSGQGGSVDANIERWYGQFERPDGKSVKDSAKVDKKE